MDKPELGADPRLAENAGRVEHQKEIEDAIEAWTLTLDSEEALSKLDDVSVAAGPILNVKDMFENEQYRARELFQEVTIDGEPLSIPAIIPRLSKTPGETDFPGPELGEHNQEVLKDILKLSDGEINTLKENGII